MARGQGRGRGPKKRRRVGLSEREQKRLKRTLVTKKAAAKEREAEQQRTESGATAENRGRIEAYMLQHGLSANEAKIALRLKHRKGTKRRK